MPVVIRYTTTIGADAYDEIAARIRFHDDVPEGLIVHSAAVTDAGQMRVFDVWRNVEAFERFLETRLGPALADVAGPHQQEADAVEVFELHSLVRQGRPLAS
ncbi:MAG: hypothetical protein JW895_01980 [Thermoleophilaceae bacterium]|nr:hypothetical protein [Thermoleophilaceae bacterium]